MKYWQYTHRICLILLLLAVAIDNPFAQEADSDIDLGSDERTGIIDSINPRAGLVILFESVNTVDRDAGQVRSVATMETLGLGITIPVYEDLLTFEPVLNVGIIDLRFDGGDAGSSSLNVPIPRNFFNPRNNAYTTTLVFMLSLPIEVQFLLDQYLVIGVGISPTINLRFAISGTDQQEMSAIATYYSEKGRFFTPETYAKVGYRFSDVQINALVSALWPVYNIWSGENLPFLHDLYLIGGIQFQFAL